MEDSDITNGIEFAVVRTPVERSAQHGRIIDANGDTVYDLVPEDDLPAVGEIRWTLVRTPNGWRLLDQETIS